MNIKKPSCGRLMISILLREGVFASGIIRGRTGVSAYFASPTSITSPMAAPLLTVTVREVISIGSKVSSA